MRTIIVPKSRNALLIAQLASLYKTLKGVKNNESVNFDLCELEWACPLLILPLSAYIDSTNSQATTNECEINGYLFNIDFPNGIDSVSEFQKIIQSKKSYIPISILRRKAAEEREKLETMFATMVFNTLEKTPTGTRNAIYQPISELVTNIFEHSKKDTGYIFGQIYQKKNYLDICIVDCGRGLQKTYQEEKNLKISDQESIIEVMKGNSVKPDKERGYGVRSSRNIVCDGLSGQFAIVSGSAALISIKNYNKIVSLDDFYWQGVIIAYRIPKPIKPIDITPFLE